MTTVLNFLFKRENPELHMMIGDLPIFSKEWLKIEQFPKMLKKSNHI